MADHLVDGELSVGDYVLAGGEAAALVVIEAVTRLVPGVMGNEASAVEESFTSGLLEYPQYTRPAEFRGWGVPEVLVSGDHGRVARWRRAMALRRTLAHRPDLVDEAGGLGEEDRAPARRARRRHRRVLRGRPRLVSARCGGGYRGVLRPGLSHARTVAPEVAAGAARSWTREGTRAMNPTDIVDRDFLRDDVPDFRPGDTLKVHVRVVEGNRERTQLFQGAVIRRQGTGARETFTVRKLSFGVGVERTFPVHSPVLAKIEVVTRGDVRRAKLYYLRGRVGKAAKIKEKRARRAR